MKEWNPSIRFATKVAFKPLFELKNALDVDDDDNVEIALKKKNFKIMNYEFFFKNYEQTICC